jgi:hypothetical protein
MSNPGASTDGGNAQAVQVSKHAYYCVMTQSITEFEFWQTIELGGVLPSILSLLFGGGDGEGEDAFQHLTIHGNFNDFCKTSFKDI